MIIIYENLEKEAQEIDGELKKVYGFESSLFSESLEGMFSSIREFNGYRVIFSKASELLKGKAGLILTTRDIYIDNRSKNDDWVFGVQREAISIVSNARMKRFDSEPSDRLKINYELYMKRLKTLAIHEIGHDVVKAAHLKPAKWVNVKNNNYELDLGEHCTDNSCVMYEIVDIKSPPQNEGYIQLGDEKRYDAGLDELIERLYPNWFCQRCKSALKIGNNYR